MKDRRKYFVFPLIALIWIIGSSAIAQVQLSTTPAGTEDGCTLKPGKTCFHVFTSTHTPTTGDSVLFQVNMCKMVSYYYKYDGASSIVLMDSGNNSTTGATAIERDWDGDGVISGIDQDTHIDGSVGTRSFSLRPKAPWQYVNVITIPASGSAIFTITCQ